MPEETTETASEKIYPIELKELLLRAEKGDESVLPDLRQALDRYPDLVHRAADLVQAARDAVLKWAAGSRLATRELFAREAAALRERLAATASSELEKLLVDRVVLSWLEVYTADIRFVDRTEVGAEGTPSAQAVRDILDRAHRRYLTAIRCLATVQRLVRPSPAPVEIASRLRTSPSLRGVRPDKPVREGVGVVN
jgi:hypothetical protein